MIASKYECPIEHNVEADVVEECFISRGERQSVSAVVSEQNEFERATDP